MHDEIPELNHVYGTIIDGAPRHPGSRQANCCIFAGRPVDRSPTGSGTAGVLRAAVWTIDPDDAVARGFVVR